MISDSQARHNIVTDLAVSFAVDAGAGTGKTTLLLERLLALLLKEEVPLSRIAAITFTDKAAGELVERLRDKLEKEFDKPGAREDLLRQALKDMEQASIATIHSFCSSILREYPVEAGVDPQFKVLDQVQADALESQTWENWLKRALAARVESLMAFFELGGTFEQVESLKDHLLRNRSLLQTPKVLLLPDPKGTLADLSRLWTRLQTLAKPIAPEDTLAKMLWALGKTWDALQTLEGTKKTLALAALEIPKATRLGNQKNWEKGSLDEARTLVKEFGEVHQAFADQVKDSVLRAVVEWLWSYLAEYERSKKVQGLLDFDDLLSKTRDLLRDHVDTRQGIKNRYGRLFVDEFQDTDPLQVEIVFFLGEGKNGKAKHWKDVVLEPGKLFIVGDPQQSIYRFRRADVEIYGEAKERLIASGGKVEKLTENFRTLPSIVQWVNQGFEKLFAEGAFPYTPQSAHREAGTSAKNIETLLGLEIPELPEDAQDAKGFRKAEAETVAAFIAELLEKKPFITDPKTKTSRALEASDIAVLFRELSNAESVYEEALRKKGVQFQMVGGKKFYNRPEIAALEALLACLESPADEAATAALLRSPLFGFTDEELFLYRDQGGHFQSFHPASGKISKAFECLKTWRTATRQLLPSETLLYLYRETNLLAVAAAQPHGEQRVANLLKVVDQCRDLESSQNFTYRAFVKWLSRQREEDAMENEAPGPEETDHQVTLMTLHKAKGLEFPVVILSGVGKAADKPRPASFIVHRGTGGSDFKVGAQDMGLCTLRYEAAREAEKQQESAEIKRLLYVGATRARECLVIPLSSQEGGGEFLKTLEGTFDLSALKRVRVSEVDGRAEAPALAVDLKEKDSHDPAVEEQSAFLKRRREEKRTLVEKRKGKTRLASVTSIVHSEDDKPQREGYSLEGEIVQKVGDEQVLGKAFGVLTHQLLEKGWDWDAPTLAKAAGVWAPALGLPSETAKEAAGLAAKALADDLLKRAKKSPHVFRELSLTGTLEGKSINAVIDLAFLEGDEWVVVDYKTDRDPERGKEAYRQQLDYYGKLITKFTGKKVKETYLYFLRSGLLEKVK